MKVLFYISTIRGGGAARVMTNIANGFCRSGHDVCFVTNFQADHEYCLDSDIERFCLEETECKKNIIQKNIHRVYCLRRIIKSICPDICFAFMRENNYRLILATRGISTKTIVSIRNDPAREYRGRVNRWISYFLFSKADGVVFQTEDAKMWFGKSVQRKSKVILNQVDEKFFFKNDKIGEYFIACGRLSEQKNYPMMLVAFAEVLKEYPQEQLRIYGEGALREYLIRLTRKMRIEEAVHFMGFSPDIDEAYKNSKALILTSDYEGMPNVVLEALASSVPVISTDCPCGGPRMVIQNGLNGFLVPVQDTEKLVENWIRILKDKNKIMLMKQKAYESSLMYTSSHVLTEWLNYAEKIVL